MYRAILTVQGVEWAEIKWLSTEAPAPTQEVPLENDDENRKISGITPDDIHIPRIPTSNDKTDTTVWTVESAILWPGMTEDERTHDGLWVKADGGLTGT